MLILALDLATTTGFALGAPGEIPSCGVVSFGDADSSSDAVFANALKWFSEFLKAEPRPAQIILEAMLPPQALKGETNRAARDRLAGLHGIIRGVAHLRGVYDVGQVSVLSVRGHFLGNQRKMSKQMVFDKCKMLGWPVTDLNTSDACATWHYACALIRPETALAVTPLFGTYGKRTYRVSA
jgi:hypothetical protein